MVLENLFFDDVGFETQEYVVLLGLVGLVGDPFYWTSSL